MKAGTNNIEQSGNKTESEASANITRRKKSGLLSLLDISRWISYEKIIANLPFIFFIAVVGIVYIWNAHQVEKMVRELNAYDKKMKELKWEYTTSKSELEYSSKMSEVEKIVQPTGLEHLSVPPIKIIQETNGN